MAERPAPPPPAQRPAAQCAEPAAPTRAAAPRAEPAASPPAEEVWTAEKSAAQLTEAARAARAPAEAAQCAEVEQRAQMEHPAEVTLLQAAKEPAEVAWPEEVAQFANAETKLEEESLAGTSETEVEAANESDTADEADVSGEAKTTELETEAVAAGEAEAEAADEAETSETESEGETRTVAVEAMQSEGVVAVATVEAVEPDTFLEWKQEPIPDRKREYIEPEADTEADTEEHPEEIAAAHGMMEDEQVELTADLIEESVSMAKEKVMAAAMSESKEEAVAMASSKEGAKLMSEATKGVIAIVEVIKESKAKETVIENSKDPAISKWEAMEEVMTEALSMATAKVEAIAEVQVIQTVEEREEEMKAEPKGETKLESKKEVMEDVMDANAMAEADDGETMPKDASGEAMRAGPDGEALPEISHDQASEKVANSEAMPHQLAGLWMGMASPGEGTANELTMQPNRKAAWAIDHGAAQDAELAVVVQLLSCEIIALEHERKFKILEERAKRDAGVELKGGGLGRSEVEQVITEGCSQDMDECNSQEMRSKLQGKEHKQSPIFEAKVRCPGIEDERREDDERGRGCESVESCQEGLVRSDEYASLRAQCELPKPSQQTGEAELSRLQCLMQRRDAAVNTDFKSDFSIRPPTYGGNGHAWSGLDATQVANAKLEYEMPSFSSLQAQPQEETRASQSFLRRPFDTCDHQSLQRTSRAGLASTTKDLPGGLTPVEKDSPHYESEATCQEGRALPAETLSSHGGLSLQEQAGDFDQEDWPYSNVCRDAARTPPRHQRQAPSPPSEPLGLQPLSPPSPPTYHQRKWHQPPLPSQLPSPPLKLYTSSQPRGTSTPEAIPPSPPPLAPPPAELGAIPTSVPSPFVQTDQPPSPRPHLAPPIVMGLVNASEPSDYVYEDELNSPWSDVDRRKLELLAEPPSHSRLRPLLQWLAHRQSMEDDDTLDPPYRLEPFPPAPVETNSLPSDARISALRESGWPGLDGHFQAGSAPCTPSAEELGI